MAQIRYRTFELRGGFSPVMKKSSRIKSTDLPFTSFCLLIINLPLDKIMSLSHPTLVKRLEKNWDKKLSSLRCSTGDFGKALREGRVSLGHVFAEIYSLCLDYVTGCLNHGHVLFDEAFKLELGLCTEKRTVYRVRLFFSEELPPGFSGLEHLVVGYLNKAIEDEPFNIEKRLKQFVAYREVPK